MAAEAKIRITAEDQTEAGLRKSQEGIGKLTKAIKAYWVEALAAYAAMRKLVDVAADFVRAAIEEEDSIALLNATLKATGIYTPKLSNELIQLGNELQKVTRFSDDQIVKAEGILATFTQIGTKAYPEVIERAMDMSAVFGTDLQQSIVQLGKAINDPRMAEGLRRIGITMSEEQVKMIDYFLSIGDTWSAQRVILDELELELGGAARAMGETFGGKIERVKNLTDEWKAAIGKLITEEGAGLIDFMLKFLSSAEKLEKVILILKGIALAYDINLQLVKALFRTIADQLLIVAGAFLDFAKIAAAVFDPRNWRPGKMKEALGSLSLLTVQAAKDMLDTWKDFGVKSSAEIADFYDQWINGIHDTGSEAEEWTPKIKRGTDDAGAAAKKAAEAFEGYGEVLGQLKITVQDITSNEVLGKMYEQLGLINDETERAVDNYMYLGEAMSGQMQAFANMNNAGDESIEKMKEMNDEIKTQALMMFPMWSDAWQTLGDQTISFSEKMKEIFKDLFSSLLLMLSKEALTRALFAVAKLQFGQAAKWFAASAFAATAAGAVKTFQMGGIVPGGYGGGDRVPAMLEPGEMVIRKEIVREQLHGGGGPIGGDVYFDGTKVGRWLSREIASKNIPIYSGAITNNR